MKSESNKDVTSSCMASIETTIKMFRRVMSKKRSLREETQAKREGKLTSYFRNDVDITDNSIPAKKRYLTEEHFASSLKKHKETLEDEDVGESDSATKISFDYISLNLPSLQTQVVLHCLMEDAMTRNTNKTMTEQVMSETHEKHSPSDMRQL